MRASLFWDLFLSKSREVEFVLMILPFLLACAFACLCLMLKDGRVLNKAKAIPEEFQALYISWIVYPLYFQIIEFVHWRLSKIGFIG